MTLLLSSCAHHGLVDPSTNPLTVLQKNFQSICYNAEGKGRIQVTNNRYQFRFESQLQQNPDLEWIFALYLPMYGEEILKIRPQVNPNQNQSVSGHFYQRMAQELGQKKRDLKEFFDRSGVLLWVARQLAKQPDILQCRPAERFFKNEYDVGGECTLSPTVESTGQVMSFEWGLKDGVFFWGTQLENQRKLFLKAKNLQAGVFKHLSLEISDLNSDIYVDPPLKIELLLSECQKIL